MDTRPLVIWANGEDKADTVGDFLSDVSYGSIEGYISRINLIEVYYTVEGLGVESVEDEIDYFFDVGLKVVEADDVWKRVARFKSEYTPNFPLGDAFALATSVERDLPLLAGDERHWDEPRRDGYDIRLLSGF